MPLYEYQCDKCGNVFEVIQKFSDAPLTEHEGCGGHVERLLSAPGLHFKGSGWYITDYARSGSSKSPDGKSESRNDSKSDSKSESKSETKSESKSESKSDSKPATTAKSD